MPPHKKVTPWLWFVWIFLYVSSFYVCGHARPLCEAKRTVQRSSHAVVPAATPEVRASDPMVRPLVTRCVQLSRPAAGRSQHQTVRVCSSVDVGRFVRAAAASEAHRLRRVLHACNVGSSRQRSHRTHTHQRQTAAREEGQHRPHTHRNNSRRRMAACAAAPPPPSAEDEPSPGLISTLWAWAQYSLQNHLHDNAVFLAERIHAEQSRGRQSCCATCHLAAGAPNRSIAVLQGCVQPQNRYLLRCAACASAACPRRRPPCSARRRPTPRRRQLFQMAPRGST